MTAELAIADALNFVFRNHLRNFSQGNVTTNRELCSHMRSCRRHCCGAFYCLRLFTTSYLNWISPLGELFINGSHSSHGSAFVLIESSLDVRMWDCLCGWWMAERVEDFGVLGEIWGSIWGETSRKVRIRVERFIKLRSSSNICSYTTCFPRRRCYSPSTSSIFRVWRLRAQFV